MRNLFILGILALATSCARPEKALAAADEAACSMLVKTIQYNEIIMTGVEGQLKDFDAEAERAELWEQKKVPHPGPDPSTYTDASRWAMAYAGGAQAACDDALFLHRRIIEVAQSVHGSLIPGGVRDEDIRCPVKPQIRWREIDRTGSKDEIWTQPLTMMRTAEARIRDACTKRFGTPSASGS